MTTATLHYAAGGEWLQKSTHLLIAGATGSGKSNALHVILQAASAAPDGDVPIFYLCDPKRVELALWRKMAICRGACDWLEIRDLLDTVIATMDDRYRQMEAEGITQSKDTRIIVVIDELADLMSEHRPVFLPRLQKLLRLGRAARISVFAATQDPSRRTIPAELVQNFTDRVALRCVSPIESRQIIGRTGAEKIEHPGEGIWRHNAEFQNIAFPLISPMEIRYHVGIVNQLCGVL